jgi:hypothetical protein
MNEELANAAKFLFSAKEESLENLKTVFGSDRKWLNFIRILGGKNSVDLSNGEQLRNFVTKLKDIKTNELPTDFDYGYVYSKLCQLSRIWIGAELLARTDLTPKITRYPNNVKCLISFEVPTQELNIVWAVVLITFIKVSDNKDFEQKLIQLIELSRTKTSHSSNETTSYSPNAKSSEIYSPNQKKRMSLILVFDKSHLDSLVKIKEEQKITDNDYNLLVNGMEWYWFGGSGDDLTIPNDEVGNMCWLRFDFLSFDQPEIKGQCRLALKNLIKEIKNLSVDGTKISTGGCFQFRILSDKGFTKL